MHFSQFYFGSDAAQPPEIDTNFVEKTVISTKYDLGKRCNFLVSKTKTIKNQCSGASGSHHGFMYTRVCSQILEHSKVVVGDICLSH